MNWAILVAGVAAGLALLVSSLVVERIQGDSLENARQRLVENPNSEAAIQNLEVAYRVQNQIDMFRYVGIALVPVSGFIAVKN